MTDEAMAEDWIRKNCCECCLNKDECDSGNINCFSKNAFLAGLKAGKDTNVSIKWHDLLKNPTDVPKENVTVLLLTEVETVTARYDNKYEAFFRLNDKLNYCVFIAPMSYIAWCEIPKFAEE